MEDALCKKNILVKNILFSISLLIICSKITVPFYPVPVTLQMFAIYFLGLTLSPKESFIAIFCWIYLGILGLPVFAPNIIGKLLTRPTSGYLIGMLLGAPIMGFIKSKNIFACFLCYLIVHFCGCLWLSNFVEFNKIFQLGVTPFIIPEMLKIVIICFSKRIINKLFSF